MQHARLFISVFATLGAVACSSSSSTGSPPASSDSGTTGSPPSGGTTTTPTSTCNYTLSGAASGAGPCDSVRRPWYEPNQDFLGFAIQTGIGSCNFELDTKEDLTSSYSPGNVTAASCEYGSSGMSAGEGQPTTGTFALSFTSLGTTGTDNSGDTTWPNATGSLTATIVGGSGTVYLTATF